MSGTQLEYLHRLVGSWTIEATHPALPDVVVPGSAEVTWLEGERFLINRVWLDHPDFPESISIIGFTDSDRVDDASEEEHMTMHYFDSRGVFRLYNASIDVDAWRVWRDAPGFSQRFTGTFSDDGDTILGQWEMEDENGNWNEDVRFTYRRANSTS